MKLLCNTILSLSLGVGLASASIAHADTKLLRFGHDNKEDMFENPAQACTGVFANIVNADTNGAIEVKVFGSNALGTAKEHVQQVMDGILQATLTSTGALAGYYPRIDVLNLPFAFDSNAATYSVFDGEFGKTLAKDIESTLKNVVVLGFPDTGGFFEVTNSKKPIKTVEDFKDIRIRTMTLPSHQKVINALGGESYPLAWGEVYSSLQTGVIDGQMNPIPIISFAKFDEVQKYMTLTNHLFSPYTFLLNKTFWDGLTPAEQNTMRYAAKSCVEASRGISRIIEASDRGVSGLKAKMEITALSPEQRTKFKELAQPAVIEHIKESLGEEGSALLEKFQAAVNEANSQQYLQ